MTVAFNYDFDSHNFDSPGYITCVVPECVRDELKVTINDIKSNRESYKDLRSKLAGHLEQEYEIPITPNIKYLSETLSIEYDKLFNGGSPASTSKSQHFWDEENEIKFRYELKTLWINFSKKHDFNPTHLHSGSYSFVIWVEIPYNLDEELSRYSSNGNETSLFGFSYTNSLGKICKKTLSIDKSWEWKMAFFPATLQHSVNPFYTSDDYRISIAGNVYCIPIY